ncbi:hypothetical protein L195_g018598 [Trifolium pratense]|uniref:DUF674 family protein n=1 Tax=Trifolium pratense TaxID=57577 RepID=A0A2K3MX91_TRIPR|nr:hypothetical protein L195_g018598 [Trifolium pratense]
MPSPSDSSKMNIKVVQSKSQNKIITIEDNGDFVDFIFSFLTMPLGSIVKLLGANSFAGSGCVGNLYKSVENLDPTSVLLNPGIGPQLGCPNQPLNIPHLQPPSTREVTVKGGVISKSKGSIYNAKTLIALDPRLFNSSEEGVVGFMKRTTFYGVGDNLEVKPLSANFCLSYLKELSLPIDDLEVKVIPIGETEALRFLGAFLTSKFTLTNGLQDFLNVTEQESTILKVPKQES